MKKSGYFVVSVGGICTGLINGLLGSGGGMIAVTFLRKGGANEKEAHATSVAVLCVLSAVSAGLYLWNGNAAIPDALPYLPGALLGSATGAWLMPRIPVKWLKGVFAVLMIYGGLRMVNG
jgi:uncharacterized membrane protein YfcA